MEPTTTLPVTALAGPDRQALEHLLGQSLADQQQVFIMAFTPGAAPDEATRAAARARLEQTFAATARHAREHNVTAEEADAAIGEAMDHVRRRPD